MLPYIVRFIQCLRTYRDSKVPLQLVNVWYLHDLRLFYTHHLVQIGREVHDVTDMLLLLLSLEAPGFVGMDGGQMCN